MPRYFVTTSDGFQAYDDQGVELPNVAALATMLRQTLATMLRDEGHGLYSEFSAEALDETGRHVMAALVVSLVVEPRS